MSFRMSSPSLPGIGFLVLLLAQPLLAADPAVEGTTGAKSISMVRLNSEPTIDGNLTDAEWAQAMVVDDFHQMNPVEYGTPTQKTEVRVFYTDNALFIAARMYETDPSLIRANIMRQGQGLQNDDTFNLMIDPYFDRRSGYLFEINANGVRVEGIYQNVSNVACPLVQPAPSGRTSASCC